MTPRAGVEDGWIVTPGPEGDQEGGPKDSMGAAGPQHPWERPFAMMANSGPVPALGHPGQDHQGWP